MPEITKISHGLTIGDLKYGNARPGVVEATLKPGETMEQALDELDERLNAWHRKRYPHLYQEEVGNGSIPLPKDYVEMKGISIYDKNGNHIPMLEINRNHELLKDLIDDCQSIQELQAWKEKYDVLPVPVKEHYDNKLKKLSNGK